MLRLSLLLILGMLVSVPAAAHQEHVIGRPCLSDDCSFPEIESVLREAYRRVGRGISFKSLPVQRELEFANQGKTDGSLARSELITVGYPKLVKAPFPLLRIAVSPVTTNPNIRVQAVDDLKAYRVGQLRGSVAASYICDKAGVESYEFNRLSSGIKMLQEGRIDVLLEDRVLATVVAGAMDAKVFVANPLYTGHYFHWVHRKHQVLAPKLAKALKDMLADGTTEKLLGRYVEMLPDMVQDD